MNGLCDTFLSYRNYICEGDSTAHVLQCQIRTQRLKASDSVQKMTCKSCHSESVQRLDGELTASLPTLKDLQVTPVYVCQTVFVCLDCGFTELVIPPNELLMLKKAKASSGS
jgi:hypothetical protein